jgi:hypothetical protein
MDSFIGGGSLNNFRDARTSYATNFYLYMGAGAGADSTANYNVGVGQSALGSNTTGVQNTAYGFEALKLNTTGSDNTAVGPFALQNNTTGNSNTAYGGYALQNNLTASYNTAVGWESLKMNTTGEHNTAVGHTALKENTTGSYNTTVGNWSMVQNTTGSYNTALGWYAMNDNIIGNYNTAIGHQALRENNADNNTGLGGNVLADNVSGANNTAVGIDIMLNQTNSGNNNVALGNGALGYNSGSGNVALGNGALENSYTTSSNNNTGIGYLAGPAGNSITGITRANPAVVTYSGNDNFSNGATVYIDGVVGMTQVNGNTYTVAGVNTGANTFQLSGVNSTGYTTYSSGGKVSVVVSNTTAIGYGTVILASNSIRFGNTSMTQIGGPVAWTNPSDMRDKKDIKDLDLGLDFIKLLKPVSYTLINGNARTDYGFIAQDVKAVLGERNANLVEIQPDGNQTHMLRYFDFIAPVVKALQDQNHHLEDTNLQLNLNQKDIDSIRAKLEKPNG